MSILPACNAETSYTGYCLIKKKFVQEVNAECLLFEHIKSGAHVLKIAADDINKTFSIAFQTIPESDAGTPHIMEHSVLNGSRNFPVKSPFDMLSKGSLHTFLNAMTSSAYTIYPVASMNKQDYFNLMHVYLDAVFNPRLYDDPRILMQEGWHYELTRKDAILEYKGVVYNEMKGAYSNPEREMWYRVMKNLFPENGYRFSAGGYPTAIPSLTQAQFISYHKQHYHPSNSYIYLYGNADTAEELEFINREYLTNYDKVNASPGITLHPPFDAIKEATAYYPVIDDTPIDHQSFLVMSWVINSAADPAMTMMLELLADVLVNQESGPVRKAMQEAGIGKDIYATNMDLLQPVFSIVVQNADNADKDNFRRVIINTLEQVCSANIDQEALLGSLNRMEFRLREGDDAQKGLTCIMRSVSSWLLTNDPFPSLEYEAQLATVKKSLDNSFLGNFIKNELINNPYGLLLVLEPKHGLEKELSDKTAGELAGIKNKMTPAEIDALIKNTSELIAYQQHEDSPEAIASIPLLKLTDIGPDADWYECSRHTIAGVPHLFYREFTNNIVYTNFWFDLRVLPEEMLPYAALLSSLLGKMDTANYDYEQLDNALNINTGGFNASLNGYLPGYDDNMLLPKFRIQVKATAEKLITALGLLGDIIGNTNLENRDRLFELLKRHHSQLESAVSQNGYGLTAIRLESYYSRRGVFADKTRGIDYYWFITRLVKHFNDDPMAVITSLKKVNDLLFAKSNLIAGITCSGDDFVAYSSGFETLATCLDSKHAVQHVWKLENTPKNEGILTASKVQYVLQGFDFRKLGLTWDGKWKVLSQIMSTDWLQTRIRIIGGAYGGYSAFSKNGTIYMASYRDPNLNETLVNFRGTVDYLVNFEADSTAMTRYIIGTIANLDNPLTPSEKGDQAFRWFFERVTHSEVQADRDAVLATTAADIRNMSDVIARVVDQYIICVYGNDEKLRANNTLFKSLVTLQQ
jgi:presequence protease